MDEISVHRMQALHAFGDVARTFDLHLAENGLQSPFMKAFPMTPGEGLLRCENAIGIDVQ